MPGNLRQHPFTKAFTWQAITGENLTVAEFDHLPGVYGILLKELPRPGSVQITFTDTSAVAIVVNQDPLTGQVRVDHQRGHVLFNPADDGQAVSVSYDGGGTNLHLEALKEIMREVIAEN